MEKRSRDDRHDNFRLSEEMMREVQDDKVGTFTHAKFFKLSGYISRLTNDDKVFYLACPDC